MPLSSFLRSDSAQSAFSAPSLPSTSSLRTKTSGLWAYAADVDKQGNPPRNGKGILVWRCAECAEDKRQEYSFDGENAHFKVHLWKAHGITPAKSSRTVPGTSQMRLDMKGWGNSVGVKRIRASTTGLNASALRSAYLNWIVADNLPFKMARSPSFRMFLELINPVADQMLPRSDIMIRNDLSRAVRLRGPDIERALAAAHSKIHLIVNTWTSPNTYSLFGVKCRFLDRDYQVQDVLFGLSRIPRTHSGIELAKLLFKITETYKCMKKIGFLVSDNASTLDTMVNYMEARLIETDIMWPTSLY